MAARDILDGRVALAALLLAAFAAVGAARGFEPEPGGISGLVALGPSYRSPYEVDLNRVPREWRQGPPATDLEDFFSVELRIPGRTPIKVKTHLFEPRPINIIPYASEFRARDAAGVLVEDADAEIAKAFPPGAIGFAIKHHRPEFRVLSASQDPHKDHFKMQDTHISTVVGVWRDGEPGVITVSSPQHYDRGRFGDKPRYSMIFVRPTYPSYVKRAEQVAFQDNIRTMLIGFNAVSVFPERDEYDGCDPLAANTVGKVRSHVEMMVRAIAGQKHAQEFFRQPDHYVYCAELAFLSASAGVAFPLNESTIVPLVGSEVWQAFVRQVNLHNARKKSMFTSLNEGNPLVRLVTLKLAPESLNPIARYAPTERRQDEAAKQLAWAPMTVSDIAEHFLRTHVPRREYGERMAPAQGAILMRMKPIVLDFAISPRHPGRERAEHLFDSLVNIVGKEYSSYESFRRALEPLRRRARGIGGSDGGEGAGLYVPPSLFHVVAQGEPSGGVLGLQYVGHGIHFSAVRRGR